MRCIHQAVTYYSHIANCNGIFRPGRNGCEYMVDPLIWIVIGGFLEPVWVIALKRLNENRTLPNLLIAGFFIILSPLFLSFGMEEMGMGVAYSIWTGIGAVATLIVGYFLYHDDLGFRKMFFAVLIITGVIGLELSSGASL